MRRILVAVLSALMIVALSAAPGAAHDQVPPHVAGGAFAGTASLTGGDAGGLFYPVSPASCGLAVCPGKTKTWSFSGDGNGIHYEPPPGNGNADGPYVGLPGPLEVSVGGGTVTAGGIVTGGAWCGASGGTGGSGDLYLDEPVRVPGLPGTQNIHVTDVGWTQSVATLIPFHGTVDRASADTSATDAAHGTIYGVVSAIPTPGAGSCTDGTATDFTIVGSAIAIWHDGAS